MPNDGSVIPFPLYLARSADATESKRGQKITTVGAKHGAVSDQGSNTLLLFGAFLFRFPLGRTLKGEWVGYSIFALPDNHGYFNINSFCSGGPNKEAYVLTIVYAFYFNLLRHLNSVCKPRFR